MMYMARRKTKMRTIGKVSVSYGDTIMENFLDRASVRAGETALRNAVRDGVKQWFVGTRGPVKVRWEQALHCKCGCSPGFRITEEGDRGDPWQSRQRVKNYSARLKDDGTVEVRES